MLFSQCFKSEANETWVVYLWAREGSVLEAIVLRKLSLCCDPQFEINIIWHFKFTTHH